MNGLNEDDASKPFHDGQRETKVLIQQQVHRARAAKNQLQSDSAHKGRHDQWQHAQGLNEQGTAKLKTHREVGQGHGNERRKKRRHRGHKKAVEKRLAHEALLEKRSEVAQREAAISIDEGRDKYLGHGQHQEHQQKSQHQRPGQPGASADLAPRGHGGTQNQGHGT